MATHHTCRTVLVSLYGVRGLNSEIAGAHSRKTGLADACSHCTCPVSADVLRRTQAALVGQVADVLVGGIIG